MVSLLLEDIALMNSATLGNLATSALDIVTT